MRLLLQEPIAILKALKSGKMVISSRKPSAAELKRRFTSLHSWELPKQSGALAPSHVWTNRDMGRVACPEYFRVEY